MCRVALVAAVCAAGSTPAAADQLRARPHTLAVRPTPHRAADPSHSDLGIVGAGIAGAPVGGITRLRVLIANYGPDDTASTATVTVTVPTGATAIGPYFPSTCTPNANGSTVVCTFAPGLRLLKTATVQIPVLIRAGTTPGSTLSGGKVSVTSPDDTNLGNNTTSYVIEVG
ncbi:hypothetical protein J2Z21_005975 [Streptomyces griseochromogenes]|uniref:DUF11 domain-containing protein n=1 Tax=Streptomyces griseochromogenes TaxID=68214 RepID=A0A1B1AP66_9ACTN|nr:hypothetical protein [Streptomyces griseochromogenes]ANP48363.1 hypothetical protein AVL59_01165 [Streptomyces griseochromogenes]MBP2052986.1 hypothetical protein [Streptomyces griseochromogenes]